MRRLLLVLSCALPLAGVGALVPAAGAEPEPTSGGYGATSGDVALTVVSPPTGDTVYVAQYQPGKRVALALPLATTSRWPVRLVEVAPAESLPPCGWRPDRVELVDAITGQTRPFAPVALSDEQGVQLRVSGAFGCEYGETTFDGLTYLDRLRVRYEVLGGVTREADVPLRYSFGWTDDPATVLAGLVREQPPA